MICSTYCVSLVSIVVSPERATAVSVWMKMRVPLMGRAVGLLLMNWERDVRRVVGILGDAS